MRTTTAWRLMIWACVTACCALSPYLMPQLVRAQSQASPSQFPPPPPYDPNVRMTLVPAPRVDVAARRAEIAGEIASLAAQRVSLLEPLLLLGAGGGLMMGGAIGLLSTGALLPFPSHSSSEDRYTAAQKRTNNLSLGFVGAGVLAGIGGIVWLRLRVDDRRGLNERIHELKRERSSLMFTALNVEPSRAGATLHLQGRF